MKNIIVGPSHVVRWEHAVKSGSLESPFPETAFVGLGGAPVWSKDLFDRVKSLHTDNDRVLFIVGDFRFGNNIFEKPISNDLLVSGFRNITKKFINEDNDKALLERSLDAIELWHKFYGNSIGFLHWTLMMRQAEDRLKNKYIDSNGVYEHPLYNGLEIIKKNPPFSYDVSQSFNTPPERLTSYYIDGDLHPSPKRYELMRALALGYKWDDALHYSEMSFLRSLFSVINFKKKTFRKVLICGNSIFITYVLRLFSDQDLNLLKAVGIYFLFASSESLTDFANKNDIKDIVFLTKNGFHNPNFRNEELLAISEKIRSFGCQGRIGVIPWESIGYYTISFRHPSLERYRGEVSDISDWLSKTGSMLKLSDSKGLDGLYDIGEHVMPTFKGIKFILNICISILSD